MPLDIVEKDYVLGWVLVGLSGVPDLVLKGGTALSKVYFPQDWRFSEDLDFSTNHNNWSALDNGISTALSTTSQGSGILFVKRSTHHNPGYFQLRIQYDAILSKNTVKVDITSEPVLGPVQNLAMPKSYSDYPDVRVNLESRQEILAEKLRALLERTKARDYYDVWRLVQPQIEKTETKRLFLEKAKFRGINWTGVDDFFPAGLEDRLAGYWEVELGRLVQPVPDMRTVLFELRSRLDWL
jgi:predicted nucleotidyltransferase component of viral defense system